MKVNVWLVIPDLHFPFHDPAYLRVISAVLKNLVRAHRNDFAGIIQLGDFADCWQLSDYDRNPHRNATVVEDLLMYASQLDEWEAIMPEGSTFDQLEGNHEDRLRRYIWRRAPDLLKLIKSFPDILRFGERNKAGRVRFKWHDIGDWRACRKGDTIFHHGHFYNKHVAVGNLDRYPTKLVTGHTHRVQFASNGDRWSVSLGHGSNQAETAHTPVPQQWQQALGVFTSAGGIGSLEIVLVENGKCTFRGEIVK